MTNKVNKIAVSIISQKPLHLIGAMKLRPDSQSLTIRPLRLNSTTINKLIKCQFIRHAGFIFLCDHSIFSRCCCIQHETEVLKILMYVWIKIEIVWGAQTTSVDRASQHLPPPASTPNRPFNSTFDILSLRLTPHINKAMKIWTNKGKTSNLVQSEDFPVCEYI